MKHSQFQAGNETIAHPHSLTSGKICKVSISFSNGIDLRADRN